ncbi:MAG: hypothetical protein M1357_02180 [Candidatus Marsarchaeota archaeon]|nr:hypothetical protein [Candidatus Marsarchaeota archaeon]
MSVHTPFYGFESSEEGLRYFGSKMGLTHTLVQDADGCAARLYAAAPPSTISVIDRSGFERFHRLGAEGGWEVEEAVRDLLGAEGGVTLPTRRFNAVEELMRSSVVVEHGFSSQIVFSEECNTLALTRGEAPTHARRSGVNPGLARRFRIVSAEGFLQTREAVVASSPPGTLAVEYHGRRVEVVASSAGRREVEVELDGRPVYSYLAGEDLVVEPHRTFLALDAPRLYQVVNGGWGRHVVKLTCGQGVWLYCMSFG